MNVSLFKRSFYCGVLFWLSIVLLLLSCSPSVEAKNPDKVLQSYRFLCGEYTYEIDVETVFGEETPPVSNLETLLINKIPPKNLEKHSNLKKTIGELGIIEFPPVPQCHHESATLGIRTFKTGTINPLLLNIFFYENGEIDFMYFDISDDGTSQLQ